MCPSGTVAEQCKSGGVPPPDHRVTLVTRSGCHLCDDAATRLRRLAADLGFAYREVDVDVSRALQDEFGRADRRQGARVLAARGGSLPASGKSLSGNSWASATRLRSGFRA